MSDNEYTPTLKDVRLGWVAKCSIAPTKESIARFDRMIAAHDRRVAAKALTDAADAWLHGAWGDTPRRSDRIADRMAASQFAGDWLKARAAALGVPVGTEQEEERNA